MRKKFTVVNAAGISDESEVFYPCRSDNTPLWQFVEKLEKCRGGGNTSFKCNYCLRTFKGSYSRVKAHLLKIKGFGIKGCPKVTGAQMNDMQKMIDDVEVKIVRAKPASLLLPPTQTQCSITSSPRDSLTREDLDQNKKRKGIEYSISEETHSMQLHDELDGKIAKMFFSAGLPFTLTRNPYFRSVFASAGGGNIPGYVPPSDKDLISKLLPREKANIEKLLGPIKAQWRVKGVTIVANVWTDPQRRQGINFMAVNESGPVFLRAVNCEEEYRNETSISQFIKEVIEEVGPTNVVQIITDNTPLCRAAGLLVEQAHPYIFWTPCVVQTLDLALKNMCSAKSTVTKGIKYDECHWISTVVEDVMMIKNFLMNYSMMLAISNYFPKLKLLAVADTRFASIVVMLRRFKLIKDALQAVVISDKRSWYHEKDVDKAQLVRTKLLDDDWWNKIDYILAFTGPIYDMLELLFTDKPCLHSMWGMWDHMITKVKEVIYRHEARGEQEDSSFWNVVHTILHERWGKSNTPLLCLAHSLNPRYSSYQWLTEISGHVNPACDLEISSMRKECIKRLFQNEEERKIATCEVAKFLGCSDDYNDHQSLQDRGEMGPRDWWATHGASTPLIQSIALKLFGQPSSSSCCEKNWSTYPFIHSLIKYKIPSEHTKDLIFVHTNLRLLARRTPEYKCGESKMWDVSGNSFDLMDDYSLEYANYSLDIPEFENNLFVDECFGREYGAGSSRPHEF